MRTSFWISLAGWAALLGFLECALVEIEKLSFAFTWPWGPLLFRLGLALTGMILLLRRLSLRSQKNWEKVSASLSAAGIAVDARVLPGRHTAHWIVDLGLVLVNLAAIPAGLDPMRHPAAWRAAMVGDAVSFLLVWFWAFRVSRLRGLRWRERLKTLLDDLHSRGDHPPLPSFDINSGTNRGVLVAVWILVAAGLLSVDAIRLDSAAALEAKIDVSACMQAAWREAKARPTLSDPSLAQLPNPLACLPRGADHFDAAWKREAGGLTLRVWEVDSADPFGDGTMGDEVLYIGTEGKLVETVRRNF